MKAIIEYTVLREIEFTDKEMKEHGYENITWEDRYEYLNNLVDEYNLDIPYDDRRIIVYKNSEDTYYVE